jgi:hypothetical protein
MVSKNNVRAYGVNLTPSPNLSRLFLKSQVEALDQEKKLSSMVDIHDASSIIVRKGKRSQSLRGTYT